MILKTPDLQRFIGKLGYKTNMQKIEFIKMHGLGNDFVIIDSRSKNITITDNIIKKLSDRRTGAGCDQLITINNSKKMQMLILKYLILVEIALKHVAMELGVLQRYYSMKIKIKIP